jgi:hypothetical protein
MMTASTFELDDTDAAVREIQEQLRGQGGLLKNTVGLLCCYLDFITSGVVEAVCKALPFDVMGSTSLGVVEPGALGDIILTLTVLTSDDVEFRMGLSDPLTEGEEERVAKIYRELSARAQSSPALILIILPALYNLAGDMVVDVFDRESHGVPVFGMGALDVDTKIRTPKTIFRGTAYSDRMAALLFLGNLEPRFFVDSVWEHNIYTQKALVTAAEKNRMISVNNIPAAEYMRSIGCITENTRDLLFLSPLAIDSGHSSRPTLFIIYTINDDGSLTCSVNTPVGSTIRIGFPGSGEVISSSRIITGAVKAAGGEAALILSCFSRSVILTDPPDEMEAVQEDLRDSALPYMFCYAGGEICPVYDGEGAAVNQYHNYSIVACVLGAAPASKSA